MCSCHGTKQRIPCPRPRSSGWLMFFFGLHQQTPIHQPPGVTPDHLLKEQLWQLSVCLHPCMASWKAAWGCYYVFGEKKPNLIVPYSFYVVFLSLSVFFFFLIHINFASFLSFSFSSHFADQSPSYFLPDTHHLGVCKEPVSNFQSDQRRLAQLRELRAKFFLS